MTEREYLERRQKEIAEELEEIRRRQSCLKGEGSQNVAPSSSFSAPRMLTIREAAKEAHLAENYVRFLCRSDEIVYVRAGNKYLVNYEKLLDYLNGSRKKEETVHDRNED